MLLVETGKEKIFQSKDLTKEPSHGIHWDTTPSTLDLTSALSNYQEDLNHVDFWKIILKYLHSVSVSSQGFALPYLNSTFSYSGHLA